MEKLNERRYLQGKINRVMKNDLIRPLAKYGSVKQNKDDQSQLKKEVALPFTINKI